ncbi:hypothetical protein BD410DRAFT_843716 [Rickenella mellea]|uniref:Uncharacterized protein n=1 Tax=Rickenella mellea TaxID=50990 RepID=A0A4Y7PP89_9AGAM|nr:hypothetical protein BD410DRAFT_843716 [Rickenella mellea]
MQLIYAPAVHSGCVTHQPPNRRDTTTVTLPTTSATTTSITTTTSCPATTTTNNNNNIKNMATRQQRGRMRGQGQDKPGEGTERHKQPRAVRWCATTPRSHGSRRHRNDDDDDDDDDDETTTAEPRTTNHDRRITEPRHRTTSHNPRTAHIPQPTTDTAPRLTSNNGPHDERGTTHNTTTTNAEGGVPARGSAQSSSIVLLAGVVSAPRSHRSRCCRSSRRATTTSSPRHCPKAHEAGNLTNTPAVQRAGQARASNDEHATRTTGPPHAPRRGHGHDPSATAARLFGGALRHHDRNDRGVIAMTTTDIATQQRRTRGRRTNETTNDGTNERRRTDNHISGEEMGSLLKAGATESQHRDPPAVLGEQPPTPSTQNPPYTMCTMPAPDHATTLPLGRSVGANGAQQPPTRSPYPTARSQRAHGCANTHRRPHGERDERTSSEQREGRNAPLARRQARTTASKRGERHPYARDDGTPRTMDNTRRV